MLEIILSVILFWVSINWLDETLSGATTSAGSNGNDGV